jgi:hypothetical protein
VRPLQAAPVFLEGSAHRVPIQIYPNRRILLSPALQICYLAADRNSCRETYWGVVRRDGMDGLLEQMRKGAAE